MNIFFRTQTASITPCQRLASPSLPTHRPLEEIGERGLSVPLVLCSGGGDGAARGVLCTRAGVGTSALVSVGGGGEETMGEEAFKRERKYERDTRGGKKNGHQKKYTRSLLLSPSPTRLTSNPSSRLSSDRGAHPHASFE